MQDRPSVYNLFPGYEPRVVNGWLTARNDITVPTEFQLWDPEHPDNPGKTDLERIVVSYRTNGNWHGLYTVRDLIDHPFRENLGYGQQIIGDIAERIARRVTKTMLKHMNGKVGGIFDKSYSRWQRDGFTITQNDHLTLKFRNYPNVVLLEKTDDKPFEYDVVAEIDGLFDFRRKGRRYLLLVESKSGRPKIGQEHIGKVFDKLQELAPTSEFGYLVFCTKKETIFNGRLYARLSNVYDELMPLGVGTLFFSFNETLDDLKCIADHIVKQTDVCNDLGFRASPKVYHSDDEIHIYDRTGHPIRKLVRTDDGRFEELPVAPDRRGF